MLNKLQEDMEKYDNYSIEDQCDKELKKFREAYKKNHISLNENYLKTIYKLLYSGKYFIPIPFLVHIAKFYDPEELGSDNSYTRNIEKFDKEHIWFDGCGMKKTCNHIFWFIDEETKYEDILLYTVSKFIEWYPEHSNLLIIEEE